MCVLLCFLNQNLLFLKIKIIKCICIYSLGDGLQFSSSDQHAKNLTQRMSSNLIQQQQQPTMDANEISELNETRPVLNSTPDCSNFVIQMPGKLSTAK